MSTVQTTNIKHAASASNNITLDASGNVGIGAAPSARLDVYALSGVQINASNASISQRVGYCGFGNAFSGSASNHPYVLLVNDTERMRITTAGDVGIGTSIPGEALEISRTANPKIRFVDVGELDAKIGIVGSAALGFEVNGPERMRIDAAGNVGIGTSSPIGRLDVRSSANNSVQIQGASHNTLTGLGAALSYSRGSDGVLDLAAVFGWNNGGLAVAGREGIAFATGGGSTYVATVERARITSGGDFLINSTGASGTGRLVVRGVNSTVNNCVAFLNNAGDQELSILTGFELTNGTPQGVAAGTVMTLRSSGAAAGVIAFATGNTERARITAAGELLLGTHIATPSSAPEPSRLVSLGSSGQAAAHFYTDLVSKQLVYFSRTAFGIVGSISVSGSSTSYNTTSDYRLKENVVPLTDASARVQALKPSRFNFVADPDRTMDGFLAHEAAEVVPEAVQGEKDAVNEDGSIKAQGIDHSKLVPLLTAALQEALTEITALKARVAVLENK